MSILQSHDSSNTSYFFNHRTYAPKTKESDGYSVVITIQPCAEGNRLIQVSAYFHLSLSKKVYIKLRKKLSRCNGKLVLAKSKHENASQKKNDEMSQIMTNSEIYLHHCLCESTGFKIGRSSHQKCSIRKMFLNILQN